MASSDFAPLDPVIHAPIRLAVVSILTAVKSADFTYLKNAVGTTDGNLSVHLSKLEQAGYLSVKKRFREKKPQTSYILTAKGKEAFLKYVKGLEKYVRYRET